MLVKPINNDAMATSPKSAFSRNRVKIETCSKETTLRITEEIVVHTAPDIAILNNPISDRIYLKVTTTKPFALKRVDYTFL